MIDRQKVTFSYFLMLNKANKYSEDFMILSDYFNLPLTTKHYDEDALVEEIPEEEISIVDWVLSFFTETEDEVEEEPEIAYNKIFTGSSVKDYFYETPSFSILKKQNLDKKVEVFDLFKNHREEAFIRVRNRHEPEFLGEKFEKYEAEIDIKDTFIFDLEPEKKYTLDGLNFQEKKKNQGIFNNLLTFFYR